MKRLIVNADDFGITEGVNRAILETHRRGIVTSTSLVANGCAFASAVGLAKQAPALGVGVHLNLTEGLPISDPFRIPALVTRQGAFVRGPERLAAKVFAERGVLAQIEIEFCAQIGKVRAAGIEPTHLDGHQHVHMLPPVFSVAARVARMHGIHGMRCSRERHVSSRRMLSGKRQYGSKMLRQFGVGAALGLLAVGAKAKLKRAGISTADNFYGLSATGFLDVSTVEAILRDLPEGTSELMCHPGYADEALRLQPTRLVAQREVELDALTRPEIRNLVDELGIKLITYREL